MAPKLQDMPPEGGYQPINFARVPPKTYFNGISLMLGYVVMATCGLYFYNLNYKLVKKEKVERLSSKLALLPLLLAERDREYIKQLRRNRDEEEKLMANVEGWEAGTLFGEPIYKTLPKGAWVDPKIDEYYVHASKKAFNKRVYSGLFS